MEQIRLHLLVPAKSNTTDLLVIFFWEEGFHVSVFQTFAKWIYVSDFHAFSFTYVKLEAGKHKGIQVNLLIKIHCWRLPDSFC